MQTILQGIITSTQQLSDSKNHLTLQLFTSNLRGEQKIGAIDFDEKGHFKIEPDTKEHTGVQFVVKLFYKEKLVQSSAKLCTGAVHDLAFYFDPKQFSILFEYLQAALQPYIEELQLVDLNTEQMQQLACLCGEDLTDLQRLRQALLWQREISERMVQVAVEWSKTEETEDDYFKKGGNSLKRSSRDAEGIQQVCFALLKDGATDWRQAISLSKNKFAEKIAAAKETKAIKLSEALQKELGAAFSYLRDAELLQAQNDELHYEAKLLFISSLGFSEKSSLLDASLELGSLEEAIGLQIAPEAVFQPKEEEPSIIIEKAAVLKSNFRLRGFNKIQRNKFATEYEMLKKTDWHLQQFPPLLQATMSDLREEDATLDEKKFYQRTAEDWQEALLKLELEKPYPSDFDQSADPVADYAQTIALASQQAKPTYVLTGVLRKTTIPNKTPMLAILKRHPNFKIGEETVSAYFSTTDDEIKEVNLARISELSRVVRLSGGVGNLQVVEALYQLELTSATKIYHHGKARLIRDFKALQLPRKLALLIYCRAYSAYRAVTLLSTQHRAYDRPSAMIPGILGSPSLPPSDIEGIPDLEELFGSLDSCSCGHCQSVFSPAAYLYDLLNWLKTDVVCEDTGKDGYAPIEKRRPDIGHLELNCKNTNEVMPYIDLVNEQLAMGLSSTPDYTILQTNLSSPQLLVELEHEAVLADAYPTLIGAKYPLNLPFDAEYFKSKAYIAKTGVAYADLIRAFSPLHSAYYFTAEWAKAVFGICDAEYDLLLEQSAPASDFWKDYLHLSGFTDSFGALLTATGFSEQEFRALYETQFVSGNTNLELESPNADDCDWDLFKITSDFDEDLMHRLLRFFRLRRLTGLTVEQLDSAIFTNSNTAIDTKNIINIAAYIQFAKDFDLTFETVLDWLVSDTNLEQGLINVLGISTNELGRFKAILNITSIRSSITNIAALINYASKIQKLAISTVAIFEILEGTGKYEVNGSAVADPDYEAEMKTVWDALVLEYEKESEVIANAADKTEAQRTTVFNIIGHQFTIDPTQIKIIVENEATTWLDECIIILEKTDPTEKEWSYGKPHFAIKYRHFDGIRFFKNFFALSDQEFEFGVTNFINKDYQPLEKAFFWLADFATPQSLTAAQSAQNIKRFENLVWLKNVIETARRFEVSIKDLIIEIKTLQNHSGAFNQTNLSTFLGNIYTNIFENRYPEVSYQIFETTYLRAQNLYKERLLIENLSFTEQLLEISAQTNTEVSMLWSWVWTNFDPTASLTTAILSNELATIKTNLRNQFTTFEDWAKAITPTHNELRVKLRDALVAYYIGHEGFENKAAIYAHFLLDPEMDACMKTSRLKLAVSSVQLLVFRGLMNLEDDFCPDEQDKKQWEWRKNYRVWEANRKVFLYPENWIEPELRIDKTPFFEELEDALLQDEINTENSEKAVYKFLSQVNTISRLDIRAHCYDEDILHVFARTWSAPFEYYHRTRAADKKWTPWEKIEVDIEGDHLIPIIFNRRLYIFCPLFIEKTSSEVKKIVNGQEENAPYLEIKLFYSKYECGKWTAKKMLEGTLLAGEYAGLGVYNNLPNKLGTGIPPIIKTVEPNPDFDKRKWFGSLPFPKLGRGEYPDRFSPHGPFRYKFTGGSDHRGNLVLDNEYFRDYAHVSLDKNAFFFHANVSEVTGDLTIHVRRDFHEDKKNWHLGEKELAYEDCFLISACDERVSIIPAQITEERETEKRFVANPYLTEPIAQQLKKGNDYEEVGDGLFIKKHRSHRDQFHEIFFRTNGNYLLTYPYQSRDATWEQPFFYSDDKHTYWMERTQEEKCRTYLSPGGVDEETGSSIWDLNCFKYKVLGQKYQVENHEHPYACLLLSEFNRFGIGGLYDSKNPKIRRQHGSRNYFMTEYQPHFQYVNLTNLPIQSFDFSRNGSHSDYNWELFFHIPALIAKQLRQQGNFAESVNWLQYIFDPTNREMQHGDNRFWKVRPFMKDVSEDSVQNLMNLLSKANPTVAEKAKRDAFLAQMEASENRPFEPHFIAGLRPRAYMIWVVMEFVETLTAWGDMLFRQDTHESINEATNLYIMAGELLGKRPEVLQKKAQPIKATFHSIASNTADILEKLEDNFLPVWGKACDCCHEETINETPLPELAFCLPANPKIVQLWDRVEDRLFKIRHCMNIDGTVRQLPLFQPPIDPALLVQATAMGLDIGAVLADINAPKPTYRFGYILGRAMDYCNEVKSLGGALLSALEKKDGEELSLLRSVHEQNILKANAVLKKMAVEEAKNNIASLEDSKKLIEIRKAEYEGKEYKNERENNAIRQTRISEGFMLAEQASSLVSGLLAPIPTPHIGFPVSFLKTPGGEALSKISQMTGLGFGIVSSIHRNKASMSGTYASYDRRQEDWNFQIKTANQELIQIEKQLLGAQIRLAISEKDLENHELQIAQSKEVYDYVKTKFTNLNLYSWMSGQLMQLHRQAYELAYEFAKMAERTMETELNLTDKKIIQFGHFNSQKKGLLAGEQLGQQLKELDATYVRNNKRKFELTTSISLRLLNPQALIDLISSKRCSFELDEDIFNIAFEDGVSLKNIQLKSVALSMPCVTGPHISTNVKLKNGIEEIITSTGINDPAIFEPGFKEERYMPFENKLVKNNKKWEVALPSAPDFDVMTISDLVLHIRYVAEKGGTQSNSQTPSPNNFEKIMMSLRHDFPLDWQKKLGDKDYGFPNLTLHQVPYQLRKGLSDSISVENFYLIYADKSLSKKFNSSDNPAFKINGNQLEHEIDIDTYKKIEDIWLVYNIGA